MSGARSEWAIFLLMNDLDQLGGASQLLCTLALQLQRAGHRVAVYTEYPPPPGNRYARVLHDAAIPLNAEVDDVPDVKPLLALLLPARFAVALAGALLRRGSFRYCWRRSGERLSRLLIRYRFSRRARRAFTAAVAAARRDGRGVLVHVHRGAAGVRWAHALRVPVVYLENSTPTSSVRSHWWFALDPSHGSNAAKGWRALRRVRAHVDLIIVSAQRVAQAVREHVQYQGVIAILPWMVEQATVVRTWPERSSAPPSLVVGTAGRLEKEKGHAFFVHALPRVAQQTAARFVIAGDGSLRSELERLATQLGICEQVEFLGAQDNAGMARFWATIDLFVIPSLLESSPLVALEAMARRIPVIATDVGGVSELLDNGRCGRVVPPSDHAALADAIVELAINPARRAALAQAGYDRFVAVHAPDVAFPVWLQVYARVLDDQDLPESLIVVS
ncbi:MAG: glycosyltransferase family 4 protein [Deltaproteobacteria bacterium]|nr:glycosyltransferase family 4 protein [Deltaproteobacteria bacterium]MBI3390537.1 glycosyltransferase family 4 protein [Deltaproteobacteria bacterium]